MMKLDYNMQYLKYTTCGGILPQGYISVNVVPFVALGLAFVLNLCHYVFGSSLGSLGSLGSLKNQTLLFLTVKHF